MKNLVLSHKEFSGYATMTILPPTFSISIDFCKGEDVEDTDRIGCRIGFGDRFYVQKKICLFPIENDVEFIKSIYSSRTNTETICNNLLDVVISDIATYIHRLKRTDSEGNIEIEVTFPLHEYMEHWQERLNTYIRCKRYVMNHKPSKE